ncbi:MAG TPA: ABC transporter permease [Solirubrobacteraceae bacterium]|nr:ABC transporter permease [Solirubrobacteraceae bacterium]
MSELSIAAGAAGVHEAQPDPGGRAGTPLRSRRIVLMRDALMRSVLPVVLALIAGGLLLVILGDNPFTFYSNIWQYGVAQGSWESSAVLAAPLLLIAVGLIVVFRANIWNLGYDGQYLLGAALITGVAPQLGDVPVWVSLLALFGLSMAAGAAWTIIPAILKARYQTNEIITTLMMSFIGIGLANILVKGPFQDPTVNIPQTRVIPIGRMLPSIPGTRIHIGALVALGVALIAYYVLTRTAFGLRLHVLGANPRAAVHVGVNVRWLIFRAFLISGALIGLSAAVDILGLWGYVRANWNPAYGDTVIPFVFLARLNPLAVIPFIFFFAVLSTGGDLAATQANLSTDFLLVLVALILLFMTVIEFLGRRRDMGGSYLTPGLRAALRQPLMRRRGERSEVAS